MEELDGIFIAATNRMEPIEPAAKRRFDWCLALDWFRPERQTEVVGQPLMADTLIENFRGEVAGRNVARDEIEFLAKVS